MERPHATLVTGGSTHRVVRKGPQPPCLQGPIQKLKGKVREEVSGLEGGERCGQHGGCSSGQERESAAGSAQGHCGCRVSCCRPGPPLPSQENQAQRMSQN